MKVLREHIVCRELRWRMPAKEFKRHNYGWARTEIITTLLEEVGISVDKLGSTQVIPAGINYVIVIRAE